MSLAPPSRLWTPPKRRLLLFIAIHEFVKRSWWLFLFTLVCFMAFEYGLRRHNQESSSLQAKLQGLERQRQVALQIHEDLKQQINSQSDPEWIELTLMKGLGLVPEGQVKVLFTKQIP